MSKMTREDCIELLINKHKSLSRLPQKSDFENEQIMMIKSFFGPWPRALEAAGLKESVGEIKHQKTIEKRARSKRAKRDGNING